MCLEKGKGGVFGDVNLRSRANLCSIKQRKFEDYLLFCPLGNSLLLASTCP